MFKFIYRVIVILFLFSFLFIHLNITLLQSKSSSTLSSTISKLNCTQILNKCAPEFIIIGSAKSGTTSLFDYFNYHPLFQSPAIKEPNFFSQLFESTHPNSFSSIYKNTTDWYMSLFPSIQPPKFTGEASTSYFTSYLAPQRLSTILPNIKLILLLRNPIDRFESHFFFQRKGYRSAQQLINDSIQQSTCFQTNQTCLFDPSTKYQYLFIGSLSFIHSFSHS